MRPRLEDAGIPLTGQPNVFDVHNFETF